MVVCVGITMDSVVEEKVVDPYQAMILQPFHQQLQYGSVQHGNLSSNRDQQKDGEW